MYTSFLRIQVLNSSAYHIKFTNILRNKNVIIMLTYSLESQDIKGQTPLHAAVKFNYCTTVEILLKAGADPDGSDASIMTPIYVTARDNFPRTMALLIEYGADVNGRCGKMTSGETTANRCPGNLPVYMAIGKRMDNLKRHKKHVSQHKCSNLFSL